MKEEPEENGPQYLIKDEQKWLEAEKYKADIEKLRTEKYSEIGFKAIDAIKEYVISGRRNMTVAVFIFIGLIFFTMAVLTFFEKINGETFAFVSGTIIGYIISILKQSA